eukprot:TRINITY_DN23917_c0_g1_i1.p3 TRINITY_DN23917_c0_g1~~TRINITY_DN23917_c0_g1_i1.p3  ORF type:complete len:165 (-),score=36.34 TRINITY_DN23917_c0_g1_i1:6-500(-)
MMAGNLNIAHSNAFGMGHVMLGESTSMRIFGNDTSLGYKAYDGPQTSLSTTQNLYLRRNPSAANVSTRNSVTVNADGVDFSVYSGIREFLTVAGDPMDNLDGFETLHQQPTALGATYGSTFVKTGSGPMLVTSDLPVSYTHLRAHETGRNLVCRLLLEKKKKKK